MLKFLERSACCSGIMDGKCQIVPIFSKKLQGQVQSMPIKDGLFSKLMEMELGKWSCCSVIDAFHSSGPALNSPCFSPVEQIIYAHINWIKGNSFFLHFSWRYLRGKFEVIRTWDSQTDTELDYGKKATIYSLYYFRSARHYIIFFWASCINGNQNVQGFIELNNSWTSGKIIKCS